MRIPPLKLQILLESNPVRSRIFVLIGRLAVQQVDFDDTQGQNVMAQVDFGDTQGQNVMAQVPLQHGHRPRGHRHRAGDGAEPRGGDHSN